MEPVPAGSQDAAPPKPRRRLPRGCAWALGTSLTLVLLLWGGAAYWFVLPGSQQPTLAVLGPHTHGVLRVERAATDPGVRGFVDQAFRALQRVQLEDGSERTPAPLAWMRRWQLTQSGSGGLDAWLPREATLSFEPDDEGGRVVLAAANLHHFSRPVGLLLSWTLRSNRHVQRGRHRGHEIMSSKHGPAWCLVGGTLVVGSDVPAATATLDRLLDKHTAPPALPAALVDLSGRYDVVGHFGQAAESHLAAALLWRAATGESQPDGFTVEVTEGDSTPEEPAPAPSPRPAFEGLAALRFGLDLVTAEEGQAVIELDYADAAQASAARTDWAAALEQAQARLPPVTGLQGQAVQQDRRVRLTLHATGLVRGVEAAARANARSSD